MLASIRKVLIYEWWETYNVELAATIMDRHVTPFAVIFAIGEQLIHEI